ncbi:MAG: bifunctional riboflavin kinase/FAD synthetase [Nitrospirae bacterium]|nr:bifunctional riboflavin kinase/FAD synthetase [Nitrospirota bacterium]
MRIIKDIEDIKEIFQYPILTIGNFDGFHLGHQAIFKEMVNHAKEIGGTTIAFTFEPHPLKVIAPEKQLRLLSTFEEKVRLIEAEGIDILLCPAFTKDFADQHPKDFVKNILYRKLGVYEVFVGYDYAFGKGREGTVESLKEMAKEFDFKVVVIKPVKIGKEVVSSSKIRDLLSEGKVKESSLFLGRPFSLEGTVIRGEGRGATLLGFPTANININNPELLIPKEGIYAVTVIFNGNTFKGAANIGYKPTFGNGNLSLEVHILNFSGDLLGKCLRINFIERLRDEATFPNPEALSEQIKRDVESVRNVFR